MLPHRSDLSPTGAQLWSSLVPTDSIYARLADWRDVLVEQVKTTSGSTTISERLPLLPPPMVMLAMLLQEPGRLLRYRSQTEVVLPSQLEGRALEIGLVATSPVRPKRDRTLSVCLIPPGDKLAAWRTSSRSCAAPRAPQCTAPSLKSL